MQAPQGLGCPVEQHGPLFVITVLAVLSGKLNLMVCNVNETPAASQRLHQVASLSFFQCCSMDGRVRVRPHAQTRAMEAQINIAVARKQQDLIGFKWMIKEEV